MAYLVRTSVSIGGKPLSDNDLSGISIRQRIGSHHDFKISLKQDANRGVLNDKAKAWIGKPINIGIDFQADENVGISKVPDVFQGIITSVSLSRQTGTAELVVNGQSPTIVADDGPNTRSFTDKGLQEIVDEVLKPYKTSFQGATSVEPKSFTDSLPYTVQYKESNFSFIARLANRYGEWFYYDGLQLYFGKPAAKDIITLDFGENGLSYFDLSARAVPAKFELRAYDYAIHELLKEEATLSSKTSTLGKDVLGISTSKIFSEVPSMPVNTDLDESEFKNLIKRREQVLVDEIIILNGSSRNPKLKIGSKIEVKDTTINENYGRFTITSLSHDIGHGGDYFNHFEAIPEEVETAPLSSMPEPPFCETQLAKVTDVNDDKALGRVKVKFAWQEDSEEKSPWLRVASPYSGKDKGFYIIPEVDDQVLVAFENNHPDKPYVLTGMYNGEAKPEWFDAKNRYKGFKSEAQNEWLFDDKEKSITISAPTSILMTAGKEITIKTGGKSDSTIRVDAGEGTITVIAKTINIEASEVINLNSEKKIVANAVNKIDAGSMEVNVKGSATVKIDGGLIKLNS